MSVSTGPELSQFASDVLAGLSATPRQLSSKYFYDDEGSRLFQEIMKLPEYYLTRCELEIFETQAGKILDSFLYGIRPDESIIPPSAIRNLQSLDLIELGAGDGTKTAVLVSQFLERKVDLTYSPIDISLKALDELTSKFTRQFTQLRIEPRQGDYFNILRSLKGDGRRRKVLMFLGSNIGNFTRDQSIDFFRSLRAVMNENDLLFVGFDLLKDPHLIQRAYDDSAGVTAEFNLNLLRRINRELGADFDLAKWSHYAVYRPVECAARSFLISREQQTVRIEALGRSFEFEQWEAVFMEISQKYNPRMIEDLARDSGFEIKQNFFDSRNYYCDSLWKIGPRPDLR